MQEEDATKSGDPRRYEAVIEAICDYLHENCGVHPPGLAAGHTKPTGPAAGLKIESRQISTEDHLIVVHWGAIDDGNYLPNPSSNGGKSERSTIVVRCIVDADTGLFTDN